MGLYYVGKIVYFSVEGEVIIVDDFVLQQEVLVQQFCGQVIYGYSGCCKFRVYLGLFILLCFI